MRSLSARDWSFDEIDSAFDAYVWMRGQIEIGGSVIKADLIRELQAGALSSRTRSSIERRFQNFSWIFQKHGLSFIPGYVPLSHVGRVVEVRVLELMRLEGLIERSS